MAEREGSPGDQFQVKTIFNGLKFWLSHKVPMRNRLKSDIEVRHKGQTDTEATLTIIQINGGKVVLLENKADMLIADHARKDSPPGSYSWKFITESVENGVLQVEDRYRIGWDPRGEKNKASNNTQKFGRARYTPEEDAALVHWVLNSGMARQGNQLYMAFTDKYETRHPWQSWRNRFGKQYGHLDDGALRRIAANAKMLPEKPGGDSPRPTTTPTAAVAAPERTSPERQRTSPQRIPAVESPTASETQSTHVTDGSIYNGEEQFYADLDMFIEMNDTDIPRTCNLGGRSFELWDLTVSFQAQRVPAEEVDWDKVAEDLGFNWVTDRKISGQLRQYFEQNLEDFLAAMAEFHADDSHSEAGNEQLQPAAKPMLVTSPRSHMPSTPPSHFLTNKRPALDSDFDVPVSAKRRRFSRDAEIPSTPDMATRQTPTLPNEEFTADLTPSQQLLGEFDASTTPVPLRLATAPDAPSTQQQREQHNQPKPVAAAQPAVSPARKARTLISPQKPSAPVVRRTYPQGFLQETAAKPQLPQPKPQMQQQQKSAQQNLAQQQASDESAELKEWIKFYQSLGYEQKYVIKALMATSMSTGGAAAEAMESLKQGNGLPTHMEGVWTDRDDKALRMINATEVNKTPADGHEKRRIDNAKKEALRLKNKHGDGLVELRTQFLAALDAGAI